MSDARDDEDGRAAPDPLLAREVTWRPVPLDDERQLVEVVEVHEHVQRLMRDAEADVLRRLHERIGRERVARGMRKLTHGRGGR